MSALTSPGRGMLMVCLLGILEIIAGLTLLLGFLTPLAGAAATIGFFATGISRFLATAAWPQGDALTAMQVALISLALVLLGPGAFSLDARLFGRREITIPESRRPRQG